MSKREIAKIAKEINSIKAQLQGKTAGTWELGTELHDLKKRSGKHFKLSDKLIGEAATEVQLYEDLRKGYGHLDQVKFLLKETIQEIETIQRKIKSEKEKN